jgi:hypothetical protein
MNINLKLNKQGFITHYMISGPKLSPFMDDTVDTNQLRYEKYLRSILPNHNLNCPEDQIIIGKNSELGMPWQYYYSFGNWFVDQSNFYSLLNKVELVAAVNLFVEEDIEVSAYLWSYAAMDVWLNKEHICMIENPVYKPIAQQKMIMKLHSGENRIYVRMQNLGVRDTRNIFGIQILNNQEQIFVRLPDCENVKSYISIDNWLSDIKLIGNTLIFPAAAPLGAVLVYDSRNVDLTLADKRYVNRDITGLECVELDKNYPYIIISVLVGEQILSRKFEIIENIQPLYAPFTTVEQNLENIYNCIADIVKFDRGNNCGFSMLSILARGAVHRKRQDDIANIYETLNQIESRIDCSDFLVSALIRYIKNYDVDEQMSERIKTVLLNYRYWMDQIGSDGMCFWSENHSLMFYISAMNAGQMYPDSIFTRANKTGSQMYEIGRSKVLEWIEDIEDRGFEEFLSSGYTCVTFAALLNTMDYSDDQISNRATKITDNMFRILAEHTFKGSVIAPQGRVYRDVLYPFEQGVQSLINMLNPQTAYTCGEGWLAFYATSNYKLPNDLVDLMQTPLIKNYQTGNALICLNKNEDYIMTSVQSPREDSGFSRWKNLSFEPNININSHTYVKSLNERFHGTTCFEPGVYGYQQHMWYAALELDTVVFVNHPGGTCDATSMRPGYWFGNGIMPAIKQLGQVIGSIYLIPQHYPIHFTHIHWANARFEQMKQDGQWLVGKKGNGYIGIWCSDVKEPYNDQLFNVEYRVYSDNVAYLCICSSCSECDSLESFLLFCKHHQPEYNKETLTLTSKNDFLLKYTNAEDKTQYI